MSHLASRQAEIASGDTARRGWLGDLRLRYARRDGRTVLAHRRHRGPLLVQRSFHPEGAPCHNYVIHPPGGVVGGDRLHLDVVLEPHAHAVLTTPAAAKFYRSGGARAHQWQTFSVAEGAGLEFLPAETILHGASDVALSNRFHLARGARLCTWDVLCLGRPGSGDHYAGGACVQDLQVLRHGEPLLHDRLSLHHGDAMLQAPWGLADRTVVGTLVATPVAPHLTETLRERLAAIPELRLGLTRIEDILVLRCLGHGVEPVRAALEQAWSILREPVFGRPACPPRIWKT